MELANVGAKRLAHSDTVPFLEALFPTCLNHCVWTFFLRDCLVLVKSALSVSFVLGEVAYVKSGVVLENAITIK